MISINGGAIMSSRYKLARRLEKTMSDGRNYDIYLSVDSNMKRLPCYLGATKDYADFALLVLERKSRFKLHDNALIFKSCDTNDILIIDRHMGKGGCRLV